MSKRIEDHLAVLCESCGSGFDTTARRRAAGRGKFCSRACAGRAGATTHGYSRADGRKRTYNSWVMMRSRCEQPSNPRFARYGGAGISVCDRWKSFPAFLLDMGDRPAGHTLDRVDGAGNYEPGNCRWATAMEQQAHLKSARLINYGGATIGLSALARQLGLATNTLSYRVSAGWPEESWGRTTHGT